jgi:uncharacterized membrane protein YozB (DUF420 family)
MMCSWSLNIPSFYAHAIPGPIVLMCGCFNIMRFSRGQVFPLKAHIWVGRLHNVMILAGAVGAILLARISATPSWIKLAFYILLGLWVPTMLLGWWHVRRGNIKQHQRWMTRNFACTAAAITLRLYGLITLGNTPYYLMVYLSFLHLPITEIIL